MFSVMSGSVEVGIDATHDSWSELDPIHRNLSLVEDNLRSATLSPWSRV
jgi:hypothetical protein